MTIFEEALKGNVTKEMLHIAEIERVDVRKLMKKISKGEVVIMKREGFKPVGIGFPLRTKINVNFGTSSSAINLNEEFKKLVQIAVENYIDEIPIHPENLIRFTEVMLDKHQDKVAHHLTNLKKASSQLEFLLSYILRFNTLNRFVKEIFSLQKKQKLVFTHTMLLKQLMLAKVHIHK